MKQYISFYWQRGEKKAMLNIKSLDGKCSTVVAESRRLLTKFVSDVVHVSLIR